MAKELGSNLLKCVCDQHANHAIQKCIEFVPPRHIQFVYRSLCGKAKMLSSHPFGCHVIQVVRLDIALLAVSYILTYVCICSLLIPFILAIFPESAGVLQGSANNACACHGDSRMCQRVVSRPVWKLCCPGKSRVICPIGEMITPQRNEEFTCVLRTCCSTLLSMEGPITDKLLC